MDDILQVNHLFKSYGDFQLKDVSFRMEKGTIMGFVGENGAGKTTTIKSILNLIERDHGSIQVFGMDNIEQEGQIKEQIGVVFDETYFHGNLRAADIGRIHKNIFRSWDQPLFEGYLKKFRLPSNKMIKDYSRGMKMKLSIATALSHHPKLLILDEPTSGLDPVVRNEILDIFLDFIQDEEHAILFSSHITSDLEKIADYITFIHEGQVVFSESKDELLYQYGVLKCGEEEFRTLSRSDYIGYNHNRFGYEVLIKDKNRIARKNPDAVIDNVTVEDIILYYVKGEAK